MLLFPNGVNTEEDKVMLEIVNGIPIQKVSALEILGEDKRTGIFYHLFLCFVSFVAMTKNCCKAFCFVGKDFISSCKTQAQKGFFSFLVAYEWRKKFMIHLWEIGRSEKSYSSLFVDRFSKWNHQAKWGATKWPSLTVFYNYHDKVKPYLGKNLEGFLTRFWIEKMENRQAVTNRKKLVIQLLIKEIKSRDDPRIFSIASGSAEAVIEAMLACPEKKVKVMLLDLDQTALERARAQAMSAGLVDCFTFVRSTYRRAPKFFDDFEPNIVEMVGFLDYLDRAKAVDFFVDLGKTLKKGTTFLTCNILYNKEKRFLDWVLIWFMVYRTVDSFLELFVDSGLNNTIVYLEPLQIHAVSVTTV